LRMPCWVSEMKGTAENMLKRITMSLLAGLMVLTCVSCGDPAVGTAEELLEDPFAELSEEVYFENHFEPVLRFAMTMFSITAVNCTRMGSWWTWCAACPVRSSVRFRNS
jgi:hypothetical protein